MFPTLSANDAPSDSSESLMHRCRSWIRFYEIPRTFSKTALDSQCFVDSCSAAYRLAPSVIFIEQSAGHTLSIFLRQGYGGTGNCAKKSHGVSGKPDDSDRFAALAQLESA